MRNIANGRLGLGLSVQFASVGYPNHNQRTLSRTFWQTPIISLAISFSSSKKVLRAKIGGEKAQADGAPLLFNLLCVP